MASPTKRALTEETHAALVAANIPCHDSTPDELKDCLRNLGSRIRKSVSDGFPVTCYATTSVPATPFHSPTKTTMTPLTPRHDAIFKSNNEILAEVYYSPHSHRVTSFQVATPLPEPTTPTSRVRKRGRAEVGSYEDETRHRSFIGGDLNMDDDDLDGDDDPVVFILSPPAERPTKPLRKSSYSSGKSPTELATKGSLSPYPTLTPIHHEMETDDDWFSRST